MFAIIETGSKQYKVQEGTQLDVELIDAKKDEQTNFEKVLFFHDDNKILIGEPYLKNCQVTGKVIGEVKGKKVIAYKYKKRKNYRRKVGHRQKYTRVKITNITIS